MATCVTCGVELHPERAEKYAYCTAPACQEQNATALTIVAVGVNKASDQYLLLDERTRADLASGKHHDQRRGSYGRPEAGVPGPGSASAAAGTAATTRVNGVPSTAADTIANRPVEGGRNASVTVPPQTRRKPWSRRQERLALLYHEQGLRPDDIATKIGLSRYLVTQLLLDAKRS